MRKEPNRGRNSPGLCPSATGEGSRRSSWYGMIISMALHSFMADINVRENQDQNFAVVYLFDLLHARKVLIAFGRGYGRLPDDPREMTGAQNEFLDRTIKGLSQEGRVVSVRLALFAEMLKGKPWTPETLKQVGGAEGVGVTFLEETFSARTAPPTYRFHQKAAQAVLRALLPETGSNIKGNMRSYDELLVVSGYGSRPNEFDELLRILNSELRLISPTEPEGSESEGQTKTQVGEKFFLLTHDYLVPSIREWLTRKQKETRRGRAELRLVDRSSLWNAKPENRRLPSLLEWTNIGLLTKKKDWTEPQRKMMRRAGCVHGLRTLALAALIALITWRGYEAYGSFQARALVDSLKTASTAEVPDIVENLSDYYRWARRPLSDLLSSTKEQSSPHLHASLALLPVDPGQVEYLYNRMLKASPTDLPVIRDALQGYRGKLVERLWGVLKNPQADSDQRFSAACALASYDPAGSNSKWDAVSRFVTDRLLTSVIKNPSNYKPLIDFLRPVRHRLIAPLSSTFRDKERSESERSFATNILADYLGDRPGDFADLLMDADPQQFSVLCQRAKAQGQAILDILESKSSRTGTPPRSDPPLVPEDAKEALARRQAKAAVALVRLGRPQKAWPLLTHSPDPRVRSYLVNWLKPLGADPEAMIAGLESFDRDKAPTPSKGQSRMEAILFHPETSMRRALILALGQYVQKELSPGDRELLTSKLLDLYETDPDAGIHGVAEWTLRRWGHQDRLKKRDDELMKVKDWGDRRWYVNGQGQTFAVIEGPVEFSMGSLPTDPDRPDRLEGELLHRRCILRRFAIAAKEVTVEQYQVFVNENWEGDRTWKNRHSPDLDGPRNGVTWYHAVAYCNWLSRKEGLPECYEPNRQGRYDEGMRIKAEALKLTGYRLPTEAEWEYACRAEAVTSRYYGRSKELLGRYAWHIQNSEDRVWPCGLLQPNDLGLFDMLGNVYEWCQERFLEYGAGEGGTITDEINTQEYLDIKAIRPLRGGSFTSRLANVRSADRHGVELSAPPTSTMVSASPGLTTDSLYFFTTSAFRFLYEHIVIIVNLRKRLPGEAGSDPKNRLPLPIWQSIMC